MRRLKSVVRLDRGGGSLGGRGVGVGEDWVTGQAGSRATLKGIATHALQPLIVTLLLFVIGTTLLWHLTIVDSPNF